MSKGTLLVMGLIVIWGTWAFIHRDDGRAEHERRQKEFIAQGRLQSVPSWKPIQVPGVSNLVGINAGGFRVVALTPSGDVWEDADRFDVDNPKRLPVMSKLNIDDVISAGVAETTTAVLRRDGAIYSWGNPYYSQLGWISKKEDVGCYDSDNNHPKCSVYGVHDAIAIASGGEHTLVLHRNGKVTGWGYNDYGQLGRIVKSSEDNPLALTSLADADVPGMDHVVAVAAGFRSSFALKSDGTVWYWGDQDDYSLTNGMGHKVNEWHSEAMRHGLFRTKPVKLPGLDHIVAISAGFNFALALKKDGSVWAWGDSSCAALGVKPSFRSINEVSDDMRKVDPQQAALLLEFPEQGNGDLPIPTRVEGIDHVVAIAAGRRHSLALKSDGTVWGWGSVHHGQLGGRSSEFLAAQGSYVTPCEGDSSQGFDKIDSTPEQIQGADEVAAIAAGHAFSAAIKRDGTLWVWGECLACGRTRMQTAP